MTGNPLARRLGVVAVALLGTTVAFQAVASRDDSGRQATTSSGATTDATAPGTSSPVPPTYIPDVNPRGLSGWGTAQPNSMAATVREGTSWTRMSVAERQKLGEQLDHVRDVALGIGTVKRAEELGYVKNFQYVDGRGYEYINWDNFKTELDLDHPTMLAFPDDAPDSRVASVAYQVLGTKEAGPPDDLDLRVLPWHFHSNLCRKGNSIVGNIEEAPDGTLYQRHVERCRNLGAEPQPQLNHWMVDLWIIPGWENPWGLVSSKHPDLIRTPTPWFTDTNVSGADVNVDHHPS